MIEPKTQKEKINRIWLVLTGASNGDGILEKIKILEIKVTKITELLVNITNRRRKVNIPLFTLYVAVCGTVISSLGLLTKLGGLW